MKVVRESPQAYFNLVQNKPYFLKPLALTGRQRPANIFHLNMGSRQQLASVVVQTMGNASDLLFERFVEPPYCQIRFAEGPVDHFIGRHPFNKKEARGLNS